MTAVQVKTTTWSCK